MKGRDRMKHRLKELRATHGWTQENLSEQVGVSRQTIISIESGRYNPSLELAYKIAKVFRCKIEDVFIFEEGSEKS
ncbi:putative transcriptional regulator [Bacillus horti]|uniref:Transcriptional regulator n=2 Tax=Caldalkalibacillus horti TaxID=77523 RepID=A0ABT9VWC2_9BACI|nr:putative transcriptional regulator [Bacillus horti]